MTPCEAVRLADVVAAELPECPRGGRGNLELPTPTPDHATEPDMDYSYGRSRIDFNQLEDSPTRRAQEFLAAPAHSTGIIEIEQGASAFGPQGITRRRLEWRDLDDDGRYIIDGRHPPIATAADATRVKDLINVEIAVVIHAIRDERGRRG
ncbi:ESX secretion-associated protein EspG [Nocardia albiluteola]|uniref:ESX secretion-associated protein EspG n=1 Tax=Nocardia albiluteola TaxID=2842303 RepID=UPI0027E0BA51|nr:ESX secretion-associated protein EspG [Nocardia albiluteola]